MREHHDQGHVRGQQRQEQSQNNRGLAHKRRRSEMASFASPSVTSSSSSPSVSAVLTAANHNDYNNNNDRNRYHHKHRRRPSTSLPPVQSPTVPQPDNDGNDYCDGLISTKTTTSTTTQTAFGNIFDIETLSNKVYMNGFDVIVLYENDENDSSLSHNDTSISYEIYRYNHTVVTAANTSSTNKNNNKSYFHPTNTATKNSDSNTLVANEWELVKQGTNILNRHSSRTITTTDNTTHITQAVRIRFGAGGGTEKESIIMMEPNSIQSFYITFTSPQLVYETQQPQQQQEQQVGDVFIQNENLALRLGRTVHTYLQSFSTASKTTTKSTPNKDSTTVLSTDGNGNGNGNGNDTSPPRIWSGTLYYTVEDGICPTFENSVVSNSMTTTMHNNNNNNNNLGTETVAPSISLVPSSKPSTSSQPSLKPSTSSQPSLSQFPSTHPSQSQQPSKSDEPTFSIHPSLTPSSEPSLSAVPSAIPTQNPSISTVPSTQPSISSIPSTTETPTDTISTIPSLSSQPSISIHPSMTPSLSESPSSTPVPTKEESIQPSISMKPSKSSLPSVVPSTSTLPTTTATPTDVSSNIPSVSSIPTASIYPSTTPSISELPTTTAVPTNEGSVEPSISHRPSSSVIPSLMPSTTSTPTATVSPSTVQSTVPSTSSEPSTSTYPSMFPSISQSPSTTALPTSITNSPSVTLEPSMTPSITNIPSATTSPSLFPSLSGRPSITLSPTSTQSIIPSTSSMPTNSVVPSLVPSKTGTPTITKVPTTGPSILPSLSAEPSISNIPSLPPTISMFPSVTLLPSKDASVQPSISIVPTDTVQPSMLPSISTGPSVTGVPTVTSSSVPSMSPRPSMSRAPSSAPTLSASPSMSMVPSVLPTAMPTATAVPSTSNSPSIQPSTSQMPSTSGPSQSPEPSMTLYPSLKPSLGPSTSSLPSANPTFLNSASPTKVQSSVPSVFPSSFPTTTRSLSPSVVPSVQPSLGPSNNPSLAPSLLESTVPTITDSSSPSTVRSIVPSLRASSGPSNIPSLTPSLSISVVPTLTDSSPPSFVTSNQPSLRASSVPSNIPSLTPSLSISVVPTLTDSSPPSFVRSNQPSLRASSVPSNIASLPPSFSASVVPTFTDSSAPSTVPSIRPSLSPSDQLSSSPTVAQSLSPSFHPSAAPTLGDTVMPSSSPTLKEISSEPTPLPSVPQVLPTVPPTNAVQSVLCAIRPDLCSLSPSISPYPSSTPPTVSPTVPLVVPPADITYEVCLLIPALCVGLESALPSTTPSVASPNPQSMPPTMTTTTAVPSIGPTLIPILGSLPSATPTAIICILNPEDCTSSPFSPTSGVPLSTPTMSPSTLGSTSGPSQPALSTTPSKSYIPTITLMPTIRPTSSPAPTENQVPSVTPTLQVSVTPFFSPDGANLITLDPCTGECSSASPCFTDAGCSYRDMVTLEWSVPFDACNFGAQYCDYCYSQAMCAIVTTLPPSIHPTESPSKSYQPSLSARPSTLPTLTASPTTTVSPSRTPSFVPTSLPSIALSISPSEQETSPAGSTQMPTHTLRPTTNQCVQCGIAAPCFDKEGCSHRNMATFEWNAPYDGCNGAGICESCFPRASCRVQNEGETPTVDSITDLCSPCFSAEQCFDEIGCSFRDKTTGKWTSVYSGCNDGANKCDLCFPQTTCTSIPQPTAIQPTAIQPTAMPVFQGEVEVPSDMLPGESPVVFVPSSGDIISSTTNARTCSSYNQDIQYTNVVIDFRYTVSAKEETFDLPKLLPSIQMYILEKMEILLSCLSNSRIDEDSVVRVFYSDDKPVSILKACAASQSGLSYCRHVDSTILLTTTGVSAEEVATEALSTVQSIIQSDDILVLFPNQTIVEYSVRQVPGKDPSELGPALRGDNKLGAVIIGVAAGSFGFVVLVAIILFLRCRRRRGFIYSSPVFNTTNNIFPEDSVKEAFVPSKHESQLSLSMHHLDEESALLQSTADEMHSSFREDIMDDPGSHQDPVILGGVDASTQEQILQDEIAEQHEPCSEDLASEENTFDDESRTETDDDSEDQESYASANMYSQIYAEAQSEAQSMHSQFTPESGVLYMDGSRFVGGIQFSSPDDGVSNVTDAEDYDGASDQPTASVQVSLAKIDDGLSNVEPDNDAYDNMMSVLIQEGIEFLGESSASSSKSVAFSDWVFDDLRSSAPSVEANSIDFSSWIFSKEEASILRQRAQDNTDIPPWQMKHKHPPSTEDRNKEDSASGLFSAWVYDDEKQTQNSVQYSDWVYEGSDNSSLRATDRAFAPDKAPMIHSDLEDFGSHRSASSRSSAFDSVDSSEIGHRLSALGSDGNVDLNYAKPDFVSPEGENLEGADEDNSESDDESMHIGGACLGGNTEGGGDPYSSGVVKGQSSFYSCSSGFHSSANPPSDHSSSRHGSDEDTGMDHVPSDSMPRDASVGACSADEKTDASLRDNQQSVTDLDLKVGSKRSDDSAAFTDHGSSKDNLRTSRKLDQEVESFNSGVHEETDSLIQDNQFSVTDQDLEFESRRSSSSAVSVTDGRAAVDVGTSENLDQGTDALGNGDEETSASIQDSQLSVTDQDLDVESRGSGDLAAFSADKRQEDDLGMSEHLDQEIDSLGISGHEETGGSSQDNQVSVTGQDLDVESRESSQSGVSVTRGSAEVGRKRPLTLAEAFKRIDGNREVETEQHSAAHSSGLAILEGQSRTSSRFSELDSNRSTRVVRGGYYLGTGTQESDIEPARNRNEIGTAGERVLRSAAMADLSDTGSHSRADTTSRLSNAAQEETDRFFAGQAGSSPVIDSNEISDSVDHNMGTESPTLELDVHSEEAAIDSHGASAPSFFSETADESFIEGNSSHIQNATESNFQTSTREGEGSELDTADSVSHTLPLRGITSASNVNYDAESQRSSRQSFGTSSIGDREGRRSSIESRSANDVGNACLFSETPPNDATRENSMDFDQESPRQQTPTNEPDEGSWGAVD